MDSYDKTYLDIDELAKKIEERIKELEKKSAPKDKEYSSKQVEKNMTDLDEIIRQIDERIKELEKEEEEQEVILDVEDLTEKVNCKLAKLDDVNEDDAEKTLYDLSEISNAINETIKALEAKRKKKKQQKAKYCDLARKKAHEQKKKNK